MTTPTGTISADDIRTEFGASGASNSVSLGAYRISQTVSGMTDLPLDTGVPNSVAVGNSAIGFGNLRGTKLNVVVDCTPALNTVATRVNAKSRYDNNTSVVYIGNFASKPASTAGKKVYIHANGTIGSDKQSSQTYCSLLTGSWDATTELIVDIGPSARIYGAGGNGGKGGNQGGVGNGGGPGTSGIGVSATNNTTIRVASGAIVRGGGGGGGGGGGAQGNSVSRGKGFVTNAGGGGGGGGQGYPGGNGGDLGEGSDPGARHKAWGSGTAGAAGSLDTAGNAGNGGAGTLGSGCQAFGGGGGGGGFAGGAGSGRSSEGNSSAGGSAGTTAKGGDGGYGQGISSKGYSSYTRDAGAGGASGHGIVVDASSSNVTVSNNGTVSSFVYSTTPS